MCGKAHKAYTRHTREEIKKALDRLRKRDSTALLTIEDAIHITASLENQENEAEDEADVIFSEDEEDSAFITADRMEFHKSEEVRLANPSFIHGRSNAQDMHNNIVAMNTAISEGECPRFNGLRIDTCPNRSSVMSLNQYKA